MSNLWDDKSFFEDSRFARGNLWTGLTSKPLASLEAIVIIAILSVVILTVSEGSHLNPVQSYASLKVRNCQIWQSGAEGLIIFF